MKHRLQALTTVSLLVAGVAHADPSYLLDLVGGGIHLFEASECPLPAQICNPPQGPFSFTGVVTVVVDTSADGTFSGNGFPTHPFLSLSFTPTSGPVDAFTTGTFDAGASVTVADGKVTSLNATPVIGGVAKFTFSGLSLQYSKPSTHHVGPYFGGGTLTPVPEPSTYALLLGGLGAVALALQRQRRLRGVG